MVAGPEQHGVVLHGLGLAQASSGLAATMVRLPSSTLSGPSARLALSELIDRAAGPHRVGPVDRVMVQVTDRLFATTPESAADRLCALGRSTSLVLCLHDLPHPAEGVRRCARRQQAYGRMARAAEVVVVASEHERILLNGCLETRSETETATTGAGDGSNQAESRRRRAGAAEVVVIPLPLERFAAAHPGAMPAAGSARLPAAALRAPELGVLGFLYPGKGIEQVIDAAAALAHRFGPVAVTNYGAVADGHTDYARQLEALSRQRGVRLTVTGFLPAADLVAALRRTSVPVAAHRHVSASGSIGTWLGAGRRPVVRAGGWANELGSRIPGALRLTDDVTGAVGAALVDPASTWLGDVRLGPGWAEVAGRHLDLLGLVP